MTNYSTCKVKHSILNGLASPFQQIPTRPIIIHNAIILGSHQLKSPWDSSRDSSRQVHLRTALCLGSGDTESDTEGGLKPGMSD